MQIVKRISDNVVQYMFSDGSNIEITESGLVGDCIALDILPETHELLTDVTAPDVFIGNALTYEGAWTIVDQAAIDAEIARLAWQPIPASVTQRQARLQLLTLNVLDAIEGAIATMDKAAQITWEFASYVSRTDPLVAQMAGMLGWTEAQTDTYFVDAAKL
jgi:hypothetical protein